MRSIEIVAMIGNVGNREDIRRTQQRQVEAINAEIAAAEARGYRKGAEDAKECVLDLIDQFLSDGETPSGLTAYDSMCMSTGEDALAFCVSLGWIKKEQVLR